DVVQAVREIGPKRFVLDGEIVIAVEGALSFDDLLLRIHPAASRVDRLAGENPADFIAFDLLVDGKGKDLTGAPLRKRRQALERLANSKAAQHPRIHLSPSTDQHGVARRWLEDAAGGLDGVMAKRAEAPYASGERSAMMKVKRM